MGLAPGAHPDGTLSGAGGIAAWASESAEDFKASLAGNMEGATGKLRGFFPRFFGVERQVVDTFVDGQRTLKGRTELLESVSGFCTLVMSKNWNVNGGGLNGFARALPFDSEPVPHKNASPYYGLFHGSGDNRHGILIEAAGTWRFDAHITLAGQSISLLYGEAPAQLWLTAWRKSTRTVYSERRCDVGLANNNLSHTIAHTVVVAPEDAGDIVVCVSFGHGQGRWRVLGGDRWSSLSVNRWDLRADGGDDVPANGTDGGNYD